MKQKQIVLVCLYFICLNPIFGQIVNGGILQIEPTTIVYFGDEFSNNPLGVYNNEGELYLNSNFINNGINEVPTSGTTYFNSSINSIQTISGTADKVNFFNLEIDNSLIGALVADNLGVIVANNVNLNNGDLRLVGESQLIQTQLGLNTNIIGSGKLLKDQQGISSIFGYNYWSSPVNSGGSFIINGGLFDGFDAATNPFNLNPVQFTTDFDGLPTTPVTISERWLYTFLPSTLSYDGWYKIYRDSSINSGLGFTMKGTGVVSPNFVFYGIPNNGDFTFPLLNGEEVLLGNPYPSAIDLDIFLNDNLSIITEVQIWVDGGSTSHYLAEYLGGYGIYNLVGGVLPSIPASILGAGSMAGLEPERYMAVAQGFFVEASGIGNVVFNNGQRILKLETDPESNFYKNTNSIKNKKVDSKSENKYIRIGYEDPEGFHRQLLLGFLADAPADLNYNRGYDAQMNDPREDELFYIIENDLTKKYVIQGVGAFDNLYEFPLGLIITELGTHTIMLDGVKNFNDKIFIYDNVLNTTFDITMGNYIPDLPPGEYLNRFSLIFNLQEESPISEIFEENMSVNYQKSKSILIKNHKDLKIKNISIFNMLGQKIVEIKENTFREKEFEIPFEYKKGIYLVIIESDKGKGTFKILN